MLYQRGESTITTKAQGHLVKHGISLKNTFPIGFDKRDTFYYVVYTMEPIRPEENILISEVSLFQGLKSTQTWHLGRKNVSCLERCPYFRDVCTIPKTRLTFTRI